MWGERGGQPGEVGGGGGGENFRLEGAGWRGDLVWQIWSGGSGSRTWKLAQQMCLSCQLCWLGWLWDCMKSFESIIQCRKSVGLQGPQH